jgi:hypothetical protein
MSVYSTPQQQSSSSSSSNLCSSESLSCNTDVTYSDKTSNSSESTTSTSTDTSSESVKPPSVKCEKLSENKCTKLVKKYKCSKNELLAISDIIVLLNFIKSKLSAVQPNVILRDTSKYTVEDNIKWLESFIDTLFCVLRKNEAYKIIKVSECKVKNESDVVSDRTYLIKVKYPSKHENVSLTIPLVFQWSQLTSNFSKSYNSVLNLTIAEINKEIKVNEAASVRPFLNN